MHKIYSEMKRNFSLDTRLRAFTIGTLLGDANINRHGNNHRLLIKHGLSGRALLEWKRAEYARITGMEINFFQQMVAGKNYQFVKFVTLSHTVLSVI